MSDPRSRQTRDRTEVYILTHNAYMIPVVYMLSHLYPRVTAPIKHVPCTGVQLRLTRWLDHRSAPHPSKTGFITLTNPN